MSKRIEQMTCNFTYSMKDAIYRVLICVSSDVKMSFLTIHKKDYNAPDTEKFKEVYYDICTDEEKVQFKIVEQIAYEDTARLMRSYMKEQICAESIKKGEG